MKYSKLKQKISEKISDMREDENGVFYPVEFDPTFSHDLVIKEQIKRCILPSELHKKEKKNKPIDNRFLSKRMREIMFLPVVTNDPNQT